MGPRAASKARLARGALRRRALKRWVEYLFLGAAALGMSCGDDVAPQGVTLPEAPERPPFADPPDAGGSECAFEGPGECDLVTGCGCASGETCRIDLMREAFATCAPVPSAPRPPYASCASGAECPPLHSCVDSVCKQQCRADQDCGWESARCIVVIEAGGELSAGYCTRECDVASPQTPDPGFQPCAEGVSCAGRGDGTDCIGALGSAAAGESCGVNDDCGAGLYCSGAGNCERICKMGSDDCGSTQRCIGDDTPLVIAGREIGTCGCRPPGQVCDLGVGCGCGAGTTCGWLDVAAGCRVLADDAVAAQERCESDLDCPALHSCIASVCQKQCLVAEDCGWAGAECVPVTGDGGEPIDGFNYCTRACDPSSPQAPREDRQPCAPGTQCFPFEDGVLCAAAGNGGAGAPCSSLFDCTAGTFCNGSGVCQRWCEVGSDECGAGSRCNGFVPSLLSSPPGVDPTELGYCACAPASGLLCDPRTDCGCESIGTCDFFGGAARYDCRVISDFPLAPHHACDREEDCPALHSCLHGICKRLCIDGADCPAPGSSCLPVSDDPSLEGWNYCTVSCDPVSPAAPRSGFEACGADVQCVAGSLGADCFRSAGSGQSGSGCSSEADCAPGLFCGFGAVCQAYCEIGASSCDAGQSCEAFDFPLRSAGRDFGRCICPAASGPCELATDCGCDPGTTCALVSIEPASSECVPIAADTAEPYGLCDDSIDCPALHSCIRGACAPRCAGDADCPGATCVQLEVEGEPISGFQVCSRNCDPVAPSAPRPGLGACGAGAQCFPFETGSECASAGTGELRSACESFFDCLPGLFCHGSGQCRAWCNVAASDCAAPDVCVPFSTPLVIGAHEWGLCLLCSDACGEPDSICQDGGPDASSADCPLGSDCTDCGARL